MISRSICASADLFTLTDMLSDELLLLQDGQSITGRLQSKRYDYYRFESHDAAQDFTVSLLCFRATPTFTSQ